MTETRLDPPDSRSRLNKRNKILISLIAALFGIASFVVGTHWGWELLEKLGEFVLLVVTLHFIYEWLVKDFDREEYRRSIEVLLKPQTATLIEISGTLDKLKSVFNLVSYSDSASFDARWKSMATRFDNFMLVGNFPQNYLDDIPDAGDKKKISIRVYRTVTERTRGQIVKAMNRYDESDSRKLNAYHIGRFDWGFTVIASNKQGSEVEALFNYATNAEDEPTGYYIFGNTAVALRNSLRSRLSENLAAVYQDESDSALLVEGEYMLDALLSERIQYKSFLHELRQGVPLRGEEAICEEMAKILERTNHSVLVTHIARGDNITKVLDSPPFKAWLDKNFAAAERGVNIKRIFLVDRKDLESPILRSCVSNLQSHQVEVKYCFLDEADPSMYEDFSIYDGKHLVFISPAAGGGWKEERTEARHSCNRARIDRYTALFSQLDRISRPFPY